MPLKNFDDTEILARNIATLEDDVSKVDVKLSEIDQLILDLKNGMNRAQQQLKSAPQNTQVGLYKIVNSSMELLCTYYATYNKFMELKYKYRSEQDDLTFKSVKLTQIELKRIDRGADSSYNDMVSLLQKFASVTESSATSPPSSAIDSELAAQIESLNDDDLYATD